MNLGGLPMAWNVSQQAVSAATEAERQWARIRAAVGSDRDARPAWAEVHRRHRVTTMTLEEATDNVLRDLAEWMELDN